jgi:hypothetical protein
MLIQLSSRRGADDAFSKIDRGRSDDIRLARVGGTPLPSGYPDPATTRRCGQRRYQARSGGTGASSSSHGWFNVLSQFLHHQNCESEEGAVLSKLLALSEKYIPRLSSSAADAHTCLRLLEATTDDPAYQRSLVPVIPTLLLALPLCLTEEEQQPLAGQCLTAILRVLVNLYDRPFLGCVYHQID